MQIEDKKFPERFGKIVPQSVYTKIMDNEMSFEVETSEGNVWYKTDAKRVISKVLYFFKLNRKELVEKVENGKITESEVNDLVKDTISKENRDLKFIMDNNSDLAQVTSKRHKQMPLGDIYEHLKVVATESGFEITNVKETPNSYEIGLSNGRNTPLMDTQVNVELGRNDSLGRAGIRVGSSGTINTCTNQIVANVKDAMVGAKELGIKDLPKLGKMVHTTNIDERLRNRLKTQFEVAGQLSEVLGMKLKEARYIPMRRELQFETLGLIEKRHNIGKKWMDALRAQLYRQQNLEPDHTETLYEFSQALTHVGTHTQIGSEEIQKKLCRIGGQVVLLGDKFVYTIKEAVKEKENKVVVTA